MKRIIYILIVGFAFFSFNNASGQSNLVFVDAYSITIESYTTQVISGYTREYTGVFQVPDTCVFKVTSATIAKKNVSTNELSFAINYFTQIESDMIALDEDMVLFEQEKHDGITNPVFHKESNLNLWLSEGQHTINYLAYHTGKELTIVLNGVLYKKIPIE